MRTKIADIYEQRLEDAVLLGRVIIGMADFSNWKP
jgi:hypothetical protein